MEAVLLLCVVGAIFSGTSAQKPSPGGTCGRNAHYCELASICPKNCDNSMNDAMCPSLAPGCECDDGYIFQDKNNFDCIRPSECPAPPGPWGQTCGRNAHYSNSASTCPKNCDNRFSQAMCAAVAPGCECNDGFIFKDKNNYDCVRIAECSRGTCGRNAYYSDNASICPKNCDNRFSQVSCTGVAPGCACKYGYIFKDKNNYDCVRISECSRRCGAHAYYDDRASYCPYSCDNNGSGNVSCQAFGPGCTCENGYLFQSDMYSDCVPYNSCPNNMPPCICGRNAHYSQSSSVCPPTCSPRGGFSCQAVQRGCECDDGYIFVDDTSSDCMPTSQCPYIPANSKGC